MELGSTLGKYQVVEEIGRGGMADVYLAYQPSRERHVAIKVLPPEYARDKIFVQRFLQEARTAGSLEHPNIVPVYEADEQGGLYYIVMPFLEGDTLKESLEREGALPLPRVCRIVDQLADALDYAHSQGVVHRDIKPSNIFIGEKDHVTLADFGIAVAAEATRLTRTGALIGTPEYMSPEQAKGEEMDWRTDIYSLGIVVYEMLAGRAPFQASTPYAVLHAHIYEAPPSLSALKPGLPIDMGRAIQEALSKDPADRYQHARELARALVGVEQEAPTIVGVVEEPALPREKILPPKEMEAPAAEAREPARPRERLRKSLAVVSSLVFVLLAVAAICGNSLWHMAFDVDFRNHELRQQNVYDAMVSLIASQVILLGESYSEEAAQAIDLLSDEELGGAVRQVMPRDWFEAQAEHVITESIGWLDSDEPLPSIGIPLEDLKTNATQVIDDLAEQELRELPVCHSLLSTTGSPCRPRGTDVDSFVTSGKSQVLTQVNRFLVLFPDKWRLEDAVEGDPEGIGQLMESMREVRVTVQNTSLQLPILTALCVALIISVFLLSGTSPRSLLNWIGGSLLAVGVLTLLATLIISPLVLQATSTWVTGDAVSLLPDEFSDMPLSIAGDFVDTTASQIRTHSLLIGGLGALFVTVSLLAKSSPFLQRILERPPSRKVHVDRMTQSEKLATAISHGCVVVLPAVLSFIVWITHRAKSDSVEFQAKQALLYQLVFVVAVFFFPFRPLLWLAASAYGLYALLRSLQNPNFEYPVIAELARRW
jgi:tRNA A-37 threonylcarbamoyl transferase component Bud32